MPFRITRRALTLPELPAEVRSVDVCFGEDRVWSIDLNALPRGLRGLLRGPGVPWPGALRPYLRGGTTVILRESGSGRELARSAARFSDEHRTTRVVDGSGSPLAVNKWGRLGRTLGDGGSGMQERILARTEELVGRLEEFGLRPFIVGGTLLGAVRDGALLPHDDDADVAYLSKHTDPADVAREGLQVARRLEALGYEVVRHSAAHLQLYFRDEAGAVDHYVDVFAAFFTTDPGDVDAGGRSAVRINQPFHVRGTMRREQMLPFGRATIGEHAFPAPADTERWLTINYDANWRTPIPGYRLVTPPETRRRFENWFGFFNSGRDFWNEHHAAAGLASGEAWATGATWILAQLPGLDSPWCIDLGCGSGALSLELASAADGGRRRVIAVDYSRPALELAAERAAAAHAASLTTMRANLLQIDALGVPLRAGIAGPFDVVANHVLDQADPQARPQALRVVRMALRSGGSAVATLYAKRDPARSDGEPSNGFWAPGALADAAAELGLGIELTRLRPAAHERRRAPYGVRFTTMRETA